VGAQREHYEDDVSITATRFVSGRSILLNSPLVAVVKLLT
jgi:hypothetical protein